MAKTLDRYIVGDGTIALLYTHARSFLGAAQNYAAKPSNVEEETIMVTNDETRNHKWFVIRRTTTIEHVQESRVKANNAKGA